MVARRRVITDLSRGDLGIAAAAVAVIVIFTLAAMHKFGGLGLAFPLALMAVITLLMRPVMAVAGTVLLTIVAESPLFGLFTFTHHLYDSIGKGMNVLDGLVVLSIASVGLELLRNRRGLQVPRALGLPLLFLGLGMVAGFEMGREYGTAAISLVASLNVLVYLLLLPVAVYNLDLNRPAIARLLGAGFAVAGVKAVLGLAEVITGHGASIEGNAGLTYYEPAPNWVILMAILFVFAALVMRAKPPRWMLATFPLLVACLLLSYRRSFWIALVLALLLVLLLGMRPVGRRLLVPASLLVVLAIWLLGSIHFQAENPVAKRISSLNPNSLQTNTDDRYRLDERANVLGEIRQHPISGLGISVPWTATVRPLPQEHPNGRQYVHFAALWFWLKLGILGLFAYIGILTGGIRLSIQAWRRGREPLLRAFALASMCGIVGVIVLDTTASFTGVDQRFTVLVGVQLGLIAALARPVEGELEPDNG
jgi:hypothetical protein